MSPIDDARRTLGPSASDETLAGSGGRVSSTESPLGKGSVLGRYVVLEELGRGAMGIVYKAFDPQLDRAVAIKLLVGHNSEKARTRLTREAQAMASISHPNVIAVHDVGTHAGRVFFAMELVDGLPLSRWRQQTEPSVEAILDAFRQAGEGIAAAHAAGVVHRDFKPDNVLIDGSGRVRVLDFGLARRRPDASASSEDGDDASIHITRAGAVLGTPAYMSPEQFAGETADARSDQFSFCVALFEALTGQRPFLGETVAQLGAAVVTGRRRASPDVTNVPARVLDALDRGLAKDPAERFESMGALLSAIAPARQQRWGRLVFGGLAMVTVASGTAYALGRTRAVAATPDPCAGVTRPIERVWSPGRELRLADAFAQSQAHNAHDMAERVGAALDDYADRWMDAAERSCRMTKVEHALGSELTFRSGHCITSSLEELDDLLDRFSELDAAGVQSSLDEVGRLQPPLDCVDPDVLELRVAYPSEPALRARVEALTPRFEELLALGRGDGDEPRRCLERIEDLEADAREIGYGPAVVRALEIHTVCAFAAGDDAKGRELQQLTFEEAVAASHDNTAMGMASDIAFIYTTRTDELDRAEAWLRRAQAFARRHEAENLGAYASVLNGWGVLESRRRNADASVRWFEQLADLTRERDPAGYVTALENIGATLANADRMEEAMDAFNEAERFAEARWGPDHHHTGTVKSKKAQLLLLQGRVEEARDAQLEAIEITKRTNTTSLHHASALYSLALMDLMLGDLEEARRWARDAYELKKANGALQTSAACGLLNTLSELEYEAGNLDEAETLAQTSASLAEVAGPLEEAKPLLILATLDIARGRAAQARATLQRAEALLLSENLEGSAGQHAQALYRVAIRTLEVGNEARAMDLFAKAEALAAEKDVRWETNASRLRYAKELSARGRNEEARALLDEIDAVYADYPYPPSVLEDAKALRATLGP